MEFDLRRHNLISARMDPLSKMLGKSLGEMLVNQIEFLPNIPEYMLSSEIEALDQPENGW